MSKLAVVRIDDRLIHGQVMTGWVKSYHINRVIIIDDALKDDEFMTSILEMAVPEDMSLDVYKEDESVDILKNLENDGSDSNVMVLTKGPVPLLNIYEKGIELNEIIVGGMGINSEREKLFRNIAATSEEREALNTLHSKGVATTFKLLPSDKSINIIDEIPN